MKRVWDRKRRVFVYENTSLRLVNVVYITFNITPSLQAQTPEHMHNLLISIHSITWYILSSSATE